MDRRDAVKRMASALAAGAAATLPDRISAMTASPMPIDRIGVQLYTVRNEMQKSVEATLARVAQIGYKEVEFAGYFGKTPAQIAALLKTNGLTSPAAHVDINALRHSSDRVLEDAVVAGHQYVVVAWMVEAERNSIDAYHARADEFNRFGEAAKRKGITFAYHNHDYEFIPMGGTTGFDTLLRATDPQFVTIELDLFWARKGGKDPVAYMIDHPGRFPMVHVKDMGADGSMVDVGAGTTDFARIFAASKGTIRHYFVEHDEPSDPFASIAASYRYLSRLR